MVDRDSFKGIPISKKSDTATSTTLSTASYVKRRPQIYVSEFECVRSTDTEHASAKQSEGSRPPRRAFIFC